jgi:ABC-type multidrug transport system fused ATPase/permease subunit
MIIIQVDDENISELNVQEYRKHLALVSQEPVCFFCVIT